MAFLPKFLEVADVSPREIILALVDELSDAPQIISAKEAKEFYDDTYIAPGIEHSVAGTLTDLEGYLVLLAASKNPQSLQIEEWKVSYDNAFSRFDSAQILRDQVRTKRFLQGIETVVNQLESEVDGEIRVYDAGCGSLPILGVYAALMSDRVKVTCI